jgi:hypothetical protein
VRFSASVLADILARFYPQYDSGGVSEDSHQVRADFDQAGEILRERGRGAGDERDGE